ncbi:hypothetical protein [Stenotrophomonas geniculata]|jgi:hypothetical protein|uniref:hypothetical protein n=1 Tax=Stenotrophomonas geniculata TaxID=86188 RepID=UPI00111007E0|nr:hypothetical protein [Stenotrophomonas maltophilia]
MRHNLSHATEAGATPGCFGGEIARHSKACIDRVSEDAADGGRPNWKSRGAVPVEKRQCFLREWLFCR